MSHGLSCKPSVRPSYINRGTKYQQKKRWRAASAQETARARPDYVRGLMRYTAGGAGHEGLVVARTERWLGDYSEIGSRITTKPRAAEVKGKRKLSVFSLQGLEMRSGRSFYRQPAAELGANRDDDTIGI